MATRCPLDIPCPSSSTAGRRLDIQPWMGGDGRRPRGDDGPEPTGRSRMSEATARRPSRWRVFAPDSAGAIYGTIAAMAVIAGAARDPSHGKALGLTVAALLVFWLAHVYAQTLSHHLRGERAPGWGAVVEAM